MSIRALPLLLSAAIGLLPLAPPEHVHEGEAPDGHHEVLAHRHGASHHVEASHDAGGHHQEWSGDEAHVASTLDPIYTVSKIYAPQPPAIVPIHVLEPPMVTTPPVPFDFIERLIHGPPRAPSPARAPPSSAFL